MLKDLEYILDSLSEEQKAACVAKGNILLTACPGSGKTRTLTHRLACLVTENDKSRKLNIAITYTNRAAEEITSRLESMEIDRSKIWVGTIHQFCMRFVIRPYSMYSERLCKGYSIIDEYVQREYGRKIAKALGYILKQHEDPFAISAVVEAYKRYLLEKKEIDFDMILQLTEELLAKCPFIAENISGITNSILVDEFQDTTEKQYSILAYIFRKNPKISMMFVGDVNQAIYGALGGVAKNKQELESLFKAEFNEMSLRGCYRSTQRIVDLYTKYEVFKTGVYSVAEYKDLLGTINYNNTVKRKNLAKEIAMIIKAELARGVEPSEICVAAPQWYLLFDLSNKLRELLPEVSFDAPDISPIKYDPLNPIFLIASLLFMPLGRKVPLKKRLANELLELLRDEFKISVPEYIKVYDILYAVNSARGQSEDGIVCLKIAILNVCDKLRISLESENRLLAHIKKFFAKVGERVKNNHLATDYDSICKYFVGKSGVVVSTIHGIKGEEYTTVIAYGLLNGYLPHWDYIYDKDMAPRRENDTKKLLYVLLSRAKENVYLFSECGRTTQRGFEYGPTDEVIDVFYN